MKKLYFILVSLFIVNGTIALWVQQNSGTDANLHSVHFPSVDTGYVVVDSGTILKTSDGGWYVGLTDLLSKSNTFKIYPNPTSTHVTIETVAVTTPTTLSISNLHRQEIITRQITEPITQIDISSLPSGIYFVRLTGERIVQVEKNN